MKGYYLTEISHKEENKPVALTDAYYGTSITINPVHTLTFIFNNSDGDTRQMAICLEESPDIKGLSEDINMILGAFKKATPNKMIVINGVETTKTK